MKHLCLVLELGGLALCVAAALAQRPTLALLGWFLTVAGTGSSCYQNGRIIGYEEAAGYYRHKMNETERR